MKNLSIKTLNQRGGLIAAALIVCTALVLGGGATKAGLPQLAMLVSGLIAGLSLVSDGSGLRGSRMPWPVIGAFVMVLMLPLVQLIPLPPDVWRNLAGREAETAIIDFAGGGYLSRPLALNPVVNLQLFASLVVLASFSLIVAKLDEANFRRLLILVLVIAGLELLIGAVQFSSDGELFDIFGNSHKGWLLGTFANRNHTGLFFATSILISAALFGDAPVKRQRPSFNFGLLPIAVLVALWLLATLGTGSRSGILLALLATALVALMVLRTVKLPARAWVVAMIGLSGLVAVLLLSDRVQNLLGRYETVGDDQRWSIWRNSLNLISNYLPWGSGFGSFPGVYNKYESMSELIPTYVNNAHNDYLELFVEAGLLGVLALVAVIILVVLGVFRGARSSDAQVARNTLVGGGVILLFALHSAVDYPVRRMGMAMMLFLAFGMLLRRFANRPQRGERE